MNKPIGRYRCFYQGPHDIKAWWGDWWNLYERAEIDFNLNEHILTNTEDYQDILDIEVEYF